MKLLLDASALVALVVEEESTPAVARLISPETSVVLLYLSLTETANALWAKVRRGVMAQQDAVAALARARLVADWIADDQEFLGEALDLAGQIGHPVYDCLYAAAARSLDASLLTCDRRFAAKLDGRFQVLAL